MADVSAWDCVFVEAPTWTDCFLVDVSIGVAMVDAIFVRIEKLLILLDNSI